MFKKVKGFEDYYEVNEIGIVRSIDRLVWNGKGYLLKRSQEIKQQTNKKGYKICYLSKNSKQKTCLVHRLVAEAFIPNPNNYEQVNHIDCNKTNNNVDNLEWCSNLQNQRHAIANGLIHRSSNCGRKKIKVKKIDIKTKKTLEIYNSIAEAGRKNKLNSANINSVCKGLRNVCGGFFWEYCKEKEVM